MELTIATAESNVLSLSAVQQKTVSKSFLMADQLGKILTRQFRETFGLYYYDNHASHDLTVK